MKSNMVHDFSRIPATDIERSSFRRPRGYKTTLKAGKLIPFLVDEVLPADTFEVKSNLMLRLINPLVCPIIDNLFFDTHYFFVPSRLVWTNFVKMMGERVNPQDSIDYTVPTISSSDIAQGGSTTKGFSVESLADYFGIPIGIPNLEVNSLPFRAYAKVWDDWYRDENLQNSVIQSSVDLDDSNQHVSNQINWNTLLPRGKRHDYFTSCLPYPQKGDGVELPLGAYAPVVGNGMSLGLTDGTNDFGMVNTSSTGLSIRTAAYGEDVQVKSISAATNAESYLGVTDDKDKSGLIADLSNATAATINSLRQAFALQRMLERDARSGSRYIEVIRSHFRTISPDARLQRSEYLGGGTQLLNISPVTQTASNTVEGVPIPVGDQTAKSVTFTANGFTKSFTEHGYVLGLVSIRSDLNYSQGLHRMWSRKGRYDYYWPALAHLGEQSVLNKEIYAQGSLVKDASGNVIDDGVFGYQERYAEYRYAPSLITGYLHSTNAGFSSNSLDVWHLAQKFTSLPLLNDTFIKEDPPLSRVLSLSLNNSSQFLLDAYIDCKATRAMPMYGVPGLVDHF